MTAAVPVDPRLLKAIDRLIEAGPWQRPPMIAIAGAQGSGKTTLARAAAEAFGAAHISLDDVYLTKSAREQMAEDVHPLFATRGPPGTHDLRMLDRLIKTLTNARREDRNLLPEFDKRTDDRAPLREWRVYEGRPKAILIDGWCLGALPEEVEALEKPVNVLERDHDVDARWRTAVNGYLAGPYAGLRGKFDSLLFLEAPAFEVVTDWRCEQEAELLHVAPRRLPASDRARLAAFVQLFERVTRNMLAGGVEADVTAKLDRNRRLIDLSE